MSIFPRGLTFIALSAMACSSEPNDDQGPRDAGGDAGLDGGADAGPVDLGPDPSLDGTTLEGIEVRWLEPVELCTAWQSGRALADELALKVHLTLGPEPRPSLGRAHLAAATLRGGQLRLGPLSDQQYAITNVSSRLTRYELQDPTANTRLSAEVQHTLPSGVLSERFLVSRQVNDRSPVQLGTRNEHHFYFTPNGRREGTDLEPCGGSAELEPGMFVLSAGTGANALTLLRFANTREVQVGSAPMVPTGGLLQLAADPYDLVPFSGFWSQTYVAGHHNWDESSLFDFTRDLGLYETVLSRCNGAALRCAARWWPGSPWPTSVVPAAEVRSPSPPWTPATDKSVKTPSRPPRVGFGSTPRICKLAFKTAPGPRSKP
jgi:hypothetical protein